MIDNLVRQHLRGFKPYTSARSEVQQATILLDANELTLGSPVRIDGISLNRYPDPYQNELRNLLAKRTGVSLDQVFVGAGSDEIIDLLIRLFCEPSKDSIAIAEPTYGVYRVAANVSGVESIAIGLDDEFQLDVQKVLESLKPATKIIFLCSPNNPTGNLLNRESIISICKATQAIVVVDQAYIEFAESSGDITDEINRYNNLVILRTLSKG
ncbi:MAG TPA: aminotransferase class I/II-fold pyridoxal phosphate-dependent enzyme, partial [Bacteroidota bacterium]